jgi:tetratricopeptide (TPR) repeat protein
VVRRGAVRAVYSASLLLVPLPSAVAGDAAPDPALLLERAVAAAESSLRQGQLQAAESHYLSALLEGWLLLGLLDRLEGRLPAAVTELRAAAAGGDPRPLRALAVVHLQAGEPDQAVAVLEPLARKQPADTATRRLLAQAIAAGGQPERAVRELEGALAEARDDQELAFALASGYLGLNQVDRAARLFESLVRARPIPQTHVLIGRTYLDAGAYDQARASLQAALRQDPEVRRAHYYLGLVQARQQGGELEAAIAEFRAEQRLAPEDPLANLELGVALAELRRLEEALPALERAAGSEPPQARAFYYLGRCQLGLGRAAEASLSLKRALELAGEHSAHGSVLRAIHNQLGQALRNMGQAEQAAAHFAESERLSAAGTDAERQQMARYLSGSPEADPAPAGSRPVIEAPALAALAPPERAQLRSRVTAALARAHLNLGVMQAQAERFERAAELIEKAAALDPALPQLDSALGVAYFNARQFEKATGPLSRALASQPADAGLKRMLGMAWLNTGAYAKAAELMQDDPALDSDPSLQFAYALALVKSERAPEAERIFARLLERHGDSAELSVLLGQAHAQQGDYEKAIASLERALQLKPDAAEANATLGEIYLRQGRFEEAERALRAELSAHPGHLASQQHLAIVLDSLQRPQEALPLLRGLVEASPESADARYLLGKILLAQGDAVEAALQLEAAARLAPQDANIPYQLGRAYQKLGRVEQAQQQFEVFRQLKAKTR